MINMFGRDYEEIGSSDKGLILKSSGKIKILWGRKFIDLIDSNGNINSNSKKLLINEIDSNEEILEEGVYLLDNELIARTRSGEEIHITNDNGNVYVSFNNILNASDELKYTALLNIGFIFPAKSDSNIYPKNGIIYIEDELSLYIIKNGVLTKYISPISDEYQNTIDELKNKVSKLEEQINSYNDIDNIINNLKDKVNNLEKAISQILAINTEALVFRLACRENNNNN